MSLAVGTRFNTCLIGEAIGVGGMGEVYRATDTKLKREVALKVLPSDFATDAERLGRFQREAEMLAALNHANIAQIYSIEVSDGITALIMELIEGPTLGERIEQGPIAADEALNIALQICAALEAAHERGIVHRDLKPANVKLKADGTVKVLDFGIAKSVEARSISGGKSPVHTTPAMTGDPEPFVVLRTPFQERWGTFSPDSRWVAYHSNESGRYEVYVRAFVPPDSSADALSGGQWQISAAGGAVISSADCGWRLGHWKHPSVRRCARRPLPDQHVGG